MAIKSHFIAIFRADLKELAARAALRCVPGVAIPLMLGLYFNHLGIGIFAASGAMSAGFGSYQQLQHSRISPMIIASIGMGISTLAGSVAGHSMFALILIVGVWGFTYGLISFLGNATSFIGLQCVIALLVTSNYTVPLHPAASRAAMVLVGGLAQAIFIALFWELEHVSALPDPGPASVAHFPASTPAAAKTIWQNLTYRSDAFQYGMRISVAMIYALIVGRWLALANSYWVPMTCAIVLKPDFVNTFERGMGRIIGTVAGAGLATAVSALLHPSHPVLVILVILFAGLSYLLLRVNYLAFAICITAYIVFLLSLAGLPEKKIVNYRTLNTTIGGALALAMHLSFARQHNRSSAEH